MRPSSEFAGDLRAFLDAKPIRARQGNCVYRARKLGTPVLRSRRSALSAAAVAILSAGAAVWARSRPSPAKI